MCYRWTESELSSLSWHFMQCNTSQDVIGDIVKLFEEDCERKTRDSVIKELYKLNHLDKGQFYSLLETEYDINSQANQKTKDARSNEIGRLCELLIQDGKTRFLEWMQRALLDTCFAKIYLEKKGAESVGQLNESSKKKHDGLPQISPVSYHNLRK